MKIAVLSDIQGNLPAMEAAVEHIQTWAPDLVIMNGDLVNRGPDSLGCLRLLEGLRRSAGWLPLRGNHEDFVLHCAAHPPDSVLDADMRRFADWTVAQLGEHIRPLTDWPDHLCLPGPTGDWIHCTHGSMAGNRDGISQSIPDQALAGRVPEDVALFVVAHTHKPLERIFRGVQIVNVGSVGSHFDGDVRASYARIEHRGGRWHTHLVRLHYDRERADRDFHDSGFLDQGGPLASLVHREWLSARLLMPEFRACYLAPLRAGAITLEGAVRTFLASSQ
jgi:predicted phosphodiesterase